MLVDLGMDTLAALMCWFENCAQCTAAKRIPGKVRRRDGRCHGD